MGFFDTLSRGARKAADKAKEYDEKMVKAHNAEGQNDNFVFGPPQDRGNRSGMEPTMPAFGSSRSTTGGTQSVLEVEYRRSTDDWAINSDSGTIKVESTREQAVNWAKRKVNNSDSKFEDYTVRDKGQGGGGGGPQLPF